MNPRQLCSVSWALLSTQAHNCFLQPDQTPERAVLCHRNRENDNISFGLFPFDPIRLPKCLRTIPSEKFSLKRPWAVVLITTCLWEGRCDVGFFFFFFFFFETVCCRLFNIAPKCEQVSSINNDDELSAISVTCLLFSFCSFSWIWRFLPTLRRTQTPPEPWSSTSSPASDWRRGTWKHVEITLTSTFRQRKSRAPNHPSRYHAR